MRGEQGATCFLPLTSPPTAPRGGRKEVWGLKWEDLAVHPSMENSQEPPQHLVCFSEDKPQKSDSWGAGSVLL